MGFIEEIEEQIRLNVPHLLKAKNIKDKAGYQLYFLFQWGNASEFIQVYKNYNDILFFDYHLNAAIVYATLQEPENAKQELIKYFDQAFSYRPLAPFLDPVLLPVIDKEFSNSMLLKFKQ